MIAVPVLATILHTAPLNWRWIQAKVLWKSIFCRMMIEMFLFFRFNCLQRNYSAIVKEALVLILTIQHFELYLSYGNPNKVMTDRNPLVFLQQLHHQSVLREMEFVFAVFSSTNSSH